MQRPERANPRAGFTVLEVLVTVALLAAALVSIGSLSAVGRRAGRSEIERVELAQVARRLENELTARNFASGATNGESGGYAWRLIAQPMVVAPPPERPARPTETASPGTGEQQQQTQAVWIPYRVILRVVGPGGARVEIETVRLGKAES